jgi:CheY-like chemotaxis protein
MKRVLLVVSQVITNKALCDQLRHVDGVSVITKSSIIEALSCLRKEDFDSVIFDANLLKGRVENNAFAEHLKTRHNIPHVIMFVNE